jgi:D-alanine transaminase
MIVYLNGSYIDGDKAVVSVNDRGFLFADGVYEVVRMYGGKPFAMAEHMQRMREGLGALRIAATAPDEIPAIADRLIRDNGLESSEATIYMQVTRGVAPRKHAFPKNVEPSLLVIVKALTVHPAEFFSNGVGAITLPDNRWSRCDIKSIALLPNVMANNAAHEADAFEALFVKDGVVIEGSHSNVFGVLDGTLITYPSCNYILSGISRDIVLRLAREMGIPVREGALPFERIRDVEEIFLTGTTTEVMPVTTLDGRPVADGRPGRITMQIQKAFIDHTRRA